METVRVPCRSGARRLGVRAYRSIDEKPSSMIGSERTSNSRARLLRIGCMRLIMIEVSPSAYPSGLLAVGKSRVTTAGGDLMRFYTNPHKFYGGIDLHARALYVCILSHDGETLLHRPMNAAPEPFLKAVAPDREGRVVAVEGLFTW